MQASSPGVYAAGPVSSHKVATARPNECNAMTEQSSLDIRPDRSSYVAMSSGNKAAPTAVNDDTRRTKPAWAEGLKRMYDEVVDEQLPDDFVELLKKLDQTGDGK